MAARGGPGHRPGGGRRCAYDGRSPYASYGRRDAGFHWFTHFSVGASTALLVMSAVAWRTGRPEPLAPVWPILGHLFAMTPDFLFSAGVAHRRRMDAFLGHVSTHFVPGRNLTWYLVFAAAMGLYLHVVSAEVDRASGRR